MANLNGGAWYKNLKKNGSKKYETDALAVLVGKTLEDLLQMSTMGLSTICAHAHIAENGTKTEKATRLLQWYEAHK